MFSDVTLTEFHHTLRHCRCRSPVAASSLSQLSTAVSEGLW